MPLDAAERSTLDERILAVEDVQGVLKALDLIRTTCLAFVVCLCLCDAHLIELASTII